MKRTSLFIGSVVLVSALTVHEGKAQLFDKLKKAAQSVTTQSAGLSEADAVGALKEAFEQGAKQAVGSLSAENGYFGNSLVKIPFPQEAKDVESTLRKVGMGKEVDNAVLSMNRAAELAAKKAFDIFAQAITKMTIQDAVNLVNGNETAGTAYLQKTTSDEIKMEFTPIVQEALQKTDATKYWSDVMNSYNKVPFVKKVNPNLTEYVTSKAMEGLYAMVAEEEKKIRKDPAARTTDLLKRVFGAK